MLKLEGVVEHVIYENPDTGYAVFEVDAGGITSEVKATLNNIRASSRRIPRLC